MAKESAHVFVSYVHEDDERVMRLAADLRAGGVDVWLDRERLMPGTRWQTAIREAVRDGAFFIACFSDRVAARERTYVHEELTLAIEELRKRPSHRAWFLPVLLDACEVPDRDIGAGESLRAIQGVRLYEDWDAGVARLLAVLRPEGGDPAPAPPGAGIEVSIAHWTEPDMLALTNAVYDRLEDGSLPADTTVKLRAPDLAALRAHVLAQSRRATDPKIVHGQRAAVEHADAALREAERWAARVLTETARHYDVGDALRACALFLRLRLVPIAHRLAHYQVETGGEQPFTTEPIKWFDTLGPHPAQVAQRVFGRSHLVGIDFTPEEWGRSSFEAFVPVERVSNVADDLMVGLPQPADGIAPALWREWVIPQMAAQNAAGTTKLAAWTPESLWYVTEGKVWVGEDYEATTGHFVSRAEAD